MRAFLMAMVMLTASQAMAVEWNPSWRYCRFDGDCTLLKDACKDWTGVNTQFARPAYDYFAAAPKDKCKAPLLLPPPKVLCNIHIKTCEVSYE